MANLHACTEVLRYKCGQCGSFHTNKKSLEESSPSFGVDLEDESQQRSHIDPCEHVSMHECYASETLSRRKGGRTEKIIETGPLTNEAYTLALLVRHRANP
jgi:hypothetical protein